MSNLVLRLLTALALIPLLVAAIEWRNPAGVWLWVFLAQVTGLREWMNMTLPREPPGTRYFGVLWGALCAAGLFWLPANAALLIGAAATLGPMLLLLFRYPPMETVAQRLAMMITGFFYAAVLITPLALFKLRPEGDGRGWIYLCLAATWLSDTGAYFAGRFIGPLWPRKLYEAVSPKKTTIGALGGMLGSVLSVVAARAWFLPALTWTDVLLIAVPANVLGQLGDLCESLIKRSVGVKDSGVLLPGHGGMLDRVDALIFVVPYVYAYATYLK